jgi:hypothetical protein
MNARAEWLGTAAAVTRAQTTPDANANRQPRSFDENAPVPIIDPAPEANFYDPAVVATVARLKAAKTLPQQKETGTDLAPETMAKLRRVTAKPFA